MSYGTASIGSPAEFMENIFIFLLPLVVTNILQSLSGTINTVFVGQMLGVQAIAAVAVFFPILFCLMAFVIGLCRFYGSGRTSLGCQKS